MSGICGIVRLDGAPASRAELAPLIEKLKQRGPDGANIWVGDRSAFGHALLATTPEALVERLPFTHQESGCTITADVRLDNREDLVRELAPDERGRVIGDGELILLAYLKWDEDCPAHLLGDFAFAIWDQRHARLFCARDQMGMRQLAYCHRSGDAFLFATDADAVVAHPDAPKELHLGRIADFLDDLEGHALHETFYAGVLRLPAAHWLVVDATGLKLGRYWRLITPPKLQLKSDAEYEEAFLARFRTAVECRLRSPGPVGAMLSGGLDSGSVCAIAADILQAEGRGPLCTFSAVGRDPDNCRETRAIQASAQIAGIDPSFVRLGELDSWREELLQLTKDQAQPFDCHMTMVRAVYLAAHRAGLKVVLDGAGGDTLFSSTDYVAGLFRDGHISLGLREARARGRFWNSPVEGWKTVARGAWGAWSPPSLKQALRRARWWARDRRIGSTGLISSDFARRTNLRGRRQALRLAQMAGEQVTRDQRASVIGGPNLLVGRERYDRVASAVGIEARDPFVDLRLIDFCLSLPRSQLIAGGWPKILLRRAMRGKLPDSVTWRMGREHLGREFTRELFRDLNQASLSSEARRALAPFVNPNWSGANLAESLASDDCQQSVEAICLFQWLKSRGSEFS